MDFRKYFAQLHGRSGRQEFWAVLLISAGAFLLGTILCAFLMVGGAFMVIFSGGGTGQPPTFPVILGLLLAVLCAVPVFTTMVRRFRDCGLPVWLAGLFPGVIALSMVAGFEERVTALILLLLFLAAGFWPGQGAEEESL